MYNRRLQLQSHTPNKPKTKTKQRKRKALSKTIKNKINVAVMDTPILNH
jgi:hypothetical protein